jgi:hypothetical protein
MQGSHCDRLGTGNPEIKLLSQERNTVRIASYKKILLSLGNPVETVADTRATVTTALSSEGWTGGIK